MATRVLGTLLAVTRRWTGTFTKTIGRIPYPLSYLDLQKINSSTVDLSGQDPKGPVSAVQSVPKVSSQKSIFSVHVFRAPKRVCRNQCKFEEILRGRGFWCKRNSNTRWGESTQPGSEFSKARGGKRRSWSTLEARKTCASRKLHHGIETSSKQRDEVTEEPRNGTGLPSNDYVVSSAGVHPKVTRRRK